jgi:hypothetical protein
MQSALPNSLVCVFWVRLPRAYNVVFEKMLAVCLPTLPCPVLQFDTLAGFSAVIDRLGESCSLHTMATQLTGRHHGVGCLSLCCCVSTLTSTPCLHLVAEAHKLKACLVGHCLRFLVLLVLLCR